MHGRGGFRRLPMNYAMIETRASQPQDEDYQGYEDHAFLDAFDALCRKAGGYRKGRKLAEKLIRNQVQSKREVMK